MHNERFMRSRKELFGIEEPIQLENEINLPNNISNDIYKCRIIYSEKIEKIEIIPYNFRNIDSLKTICNDSILYPYKFENREDIIRLYHLKEHCDDILIVRNGFVGDTSFCNIVFSDGHKLITPSTPLLKGCKREKLLKDGIIFEDEIRHTDIPLFKKAFLINAMIDIEDKIEISINKII